MYYLAFLLMINSAYAEQQAASKGMGGVMGFMPFILIIVIFYFLLIRPQQKQKAKHQKFLTELKRGDEVVTSSGIIGVITAITDKTVTIEIDENVKIKVLKGMVSTQAQQALQNSNKKG